MNGLCFFLKGKKRNKLVWEGEKKRQPWVRYKVGSTDYLDQWHWLAVVETVIQGWEEHEQASRSKTRPQTTDIEMIEWPTTIWESQQWSTKVYLSEEGKTRNGARKKHCDSRMMQYMEDRQGTRHTQGGWTPENKVAGDKLGTIRE